MNYQKIIEELSKCKKEEQWSEYQDGYKDALFEAIQIVREHAVGEGSQYQKLLQLFKQNLLSGETREVLQKRIGNHWTKNDTTLDEATDFVFDAFIKEQGLPIINKPTQKG